MAYACAPGQRLDEMMVQAYSGFRADDSLVDHAGRPLTAAHVA